MARPLVAVTVTAVEVAPRAWGFELRSVSTGRIVYTSLRSTAGYRLDREAALSAGRLHAEYAGRTVSEVSRG